MERSDAEIECGGSAGDEDTAGGRMLMAGRSVEVLPILSRAETTRSWVGLEGLTPDEMPIIDRVAVVHLAAGFCGHGFAIGPVAGQLVSEWLLDGRPSLDLS